MLSGIGERYPAFDLIVMSYYQIKSVNIVHLRKGFPKIMFYMGRDMDTGFCIFEWIATYSNHTVTYIVNTYTQTHIIN